MKILNNIILKPYTSMYVGGPARYFTLVETVSELISALKFTKKNNLELFILGRGSNIIVSDDGFDGIVIRISVLGRKILKETDEYIEIEVSAGEKWDDLVAFSVEKNLYGIENMSHVPGSVGASVVQNIGCYGQEVSESVVSVNVVDISTLKTVVLSNNDMSFSYRKSILNDPKHSKGKYVVISVKFRLQKKGKLNMKYNDISKYFEEHKDITSNLQTIRQAIINIRNSKFPFPDSPKNGSVGSFWNAEVVDDNIYEKIITKLKVKGFENKALEMINKKSVFTVAQGFKVPYGTLVEVLGFKGKSFGGAKILDTHSCVINNFTGEATATDVLTLSNVVIDTVYSEFGLKIKVEPELVGDFDLK